MARSRRLREVIPPATLIAAYSRGVFPMAETREDSDVFWIDPDRRGILPLADFHVSARLRRRIRSTRWRLTVDTAFGEVIAACAEPQATRMKTWINPLIERSYVNLAALGHAHSVEVWDEARLIGGLYGVSIGAAFFGESMFSRATDASKVALVHLVARLKAGRYKLLDAQFVTDHLKQFGAVEVSRARYQTLLAAAVGASADFHALGAPGVAVAPDSLLGLVSTKA